MRLAEEDGMTNIRVFPLSCLVSLVGCASLGAIDHGSELADSQGLYDKSDCKDIPTASIANEALNAPSVFDVVVEANKETLPALCEVSTNMLDIEDNTIYLDDSQRFAGCNIREMSEYLNLMFDGSHGNVDGSYQSYLSDRTFTIRIANDMLGGFHLWDFEILKVAVKPVIDLRLLFNNSFELSSYRNETIAFDAENNRYLVTTKTVDVKGKSNQHDVKECPSLKDG